METLPMSPSPGKDTVRLTMAQAVVKYLQSQYSERDGNTRRLIPAMFGIFGHGNVCGLGQGLEECGQDLPYYQPCNEQSMVHTAIGFAKANLRLATLACTASIGPGSTNMITGAATATINRLPVLLFPSDYYATRHQGPVLQQLEHPVSADVSVNDCFRPVSRFFDRIIRPEQLLTALPQAMRVLTDPADTGATVIALPQDIQAHAYDYPANFFRKRLWRVERRVADPRRIEEAVGILREAQRPVVIAGGGVHYSEAWQELQEFAEALGVPVAETFGGKGALRSASALALGGHGLEGTGGSATIVSQADLVICVGTRLTDFATGSQSCFNHPQVRFIGINVSSHDAYKEGALPITADAREALRTLRQAAQSAGVKPRPAYLEEVATARRAWADKMQHEVYTHHQGEAMSQGELIQALNQEARAGDTVVAAAGGPPGDLLKLWDATGGRGCHLEFGYSCMGYELPAGLGVRLAQPEGEVYVLIGDGTYLMNPTELMTAVQEGLKVTVVIAENHGYQCIRRLQMWRTGVNFGNEFRHRDRKTNRLEGEYVRLDLAKNAESFGARTWHVEHPEQLRQALREARNERRACVIVAETEKNRFLPGGGVWWDVAPAEVSQDPATQKLRAEYERDRAKLQRYHY
jgi:3D-(3,5/4)-trihydroxycyclohexane-1,2-dione acylhydrolase (decyclizing)